MPTIVTFGDSTTAEREGVEVYTAQLRKSMSPGLQWRNRGIPGNTTEMARERFARDVLAEKPQIVVIQFGINDSTIDLWQTPPATGNRVSLSRYTENLRFFIEALRQQSISLLLMTSNQLRWTDELRKLYGSAPYCPSEELGFTGELEKYAAKVREIALQEGVPLIDIYHRYSAWEKETGRRCSELLPDGMHPNTEGHRLVAEALRPVLEAALGDFSE